MTTHEAVLFDLDGVLISSQEAIIELWQRLLASHGLPLTDSDLHHHVLGCGPEHTVDALFPADVRATVLAAIRAAEPDLGYRPLPGARSVVRTLSAAGVPLALVTSASSGRAGAVLTSLGLADCFAATVAWDDTERGKPHPDPYLLAATRLDVKPERCVVVEDAVSGIVAARTAGMTCIGIDATGSDRLVRAGAPVTATGLDQVRVSHNPAGVEVLVGRYVLRLSP